MRTMMSSQTGATAPRQTALRTLQMGVSGVAIALAVLSLPAHAQSSAPSATGTGDMAGMHAHTSSPAMSASMPAPVTTSTASSASGSASDMPAVQAFKAADKHMMEQMSAGYTGNTDQDFVTHMLPHHEGAVAMAKIELQYGKDPVLKQLARNIIQAQDKEIKFMKAWQAKHPAKP